MELRKEQFVNIPDISSALLGKTEQLFIFVQHGKTGVKTPVWFVI